MTEISDKKEDFWKSMDELSRAMEEGRRAYENQCDVYWDSLSYDDKLKAFYSVVKRIHRGDMIDKGSYRWVLYDVFGFGPDAYGIGMECGYMDLHNAIDSKDY
jgi:hypothetical protein